MCEIKAWILGSVLLLVAGEASAASVYRCVNAAGVVAFSGQPCGAKQELITLLPAPLLQSDMAISPQRKKQLDLELAEQRHQNLLERADRAISQVQSQLDDLTRTTNAALDDVGSWQRSHSHADQTAARVKRRSIKRHAKQRRRLLHDHLQKLQQQRAALVH